MPGLLGLPMALLLFTFREPRRARATTASGAAENAPTFRELFRHIYAYRKAYFPIYVAMFLAAVANGFPSWLPASIGRNRQTVVGGKSVLVRVDIGGGRYI